MRKVRFTKLECEVMEMLWRHGAASAHEVRARLPEKPYSTIHMAMRRLEKKHAVRCRDLFTFEPAVSRSAACESLLSAYVGLTDETVVQVMRYFLETGRLTLADVREGAAVATQPGSADVVNRPARE